jgi:hypothetical protein
MTSHKPFAYRLSTTVSGVDFLVNKERVVRRSQEEKQKEWINCPAIRAVRCEVVVCDTLIFLTWAGEEASDQFEIDSGSHDQ